jgi:hypothetical protein
LAGPARKEGIRNVKAYDKCVTKKEISLWVGDELTSPQSYCQSQTSQGWSKAVSIATMLDIGCGRWVSLAR